MKRIRSIVHASDFSVASRRASSTAMTLAATLGARLTIVHVAVPLIPLASDEFIRPDTIADIEAQAKRWGQQQLKKLSAKATAGGVRVKTQLRVGDPVDQIVRAVRAERADMLVVGTHGRRGVSKFFLGSVAERLVQTAPCAVVTLRGQDPEGK
jgi:nucleotide-binding universal stress UspA family protein